MSETYGMNVPDTVESGGSTLRLNGAGVRETLPLYTDVPVPTYVIALYLAAPASDPAAIIASDSPWVIRILAMRDQRQEAWMEAFRNLFKYNSEENLPQIWPKLDRLAPAIPDFKGGQVLVLAYQPGTGTTVGVEGGTQVTVEGKDFAEALLRCWLGPKPPDLALKNKMLGLGGEKRPLRPTGT